MFMLTPLTLNFVDSPKAQKSLYHEKGTSLFLQVKK